MQCTRLQLQFTTTELVWQVCDKFLLQETCLPEENRTRFLPSYLFARHPSKSHLLYSPPPVIWRTWLGEGGGGVIGTINLPEFNPQNRDKLPPPPHPLHTDPMYSRNKKNNPQTFAKLRDDGSKNGAKYGKNWAQICKRFRSPGIVSKGINYAHQAT